MKKKLSALSGGGIKNAVGFIGWMNEKNYEYGLEDELKNY